MRNKTHHPGVCTAVVLLLASLLFNPVAHAAGSYLQQLEAEAAATPSPDNPPPPKAAANSPNWSQQQTSVSDQVDAGLSKAQFEESLKQRFYGSYLFYSALNNNKQKVVYQEYQKNNDIEHLRDVIKSQMTN